MTTDLPLFAPRPDPELDRLRARVAQLEAQLAELQKPKKPKPPFRMTDAHRALLAHLKGGAWHRWDSLALSGGNRFPARLAELQNAGLLTYEWRNVGGGSLTEYRAFGIEVAP